MLSRAARRPWLRLALIPGLLGLTWAYWLAVGLVELNLASREVLLARQFVRPAWAGFPVWLPIAIAWPFLLPLWLTLLTGWLVARRWQRVAFTLVLGVSAGLLHAWYWLLLLYRWQTYVSFDWFFFWYNRTDAFATLTRSFPTRAIVLLLLLPFAAAGFWMLLLSSLLALPRPHRRLAGWLLTVLLAVSFLGQAGLHAAYRGELSRFFLSLGSRGRASYLKAYRQHLAALASFPLATNPPRANRLPQRVLFIQVEGVPQSLVQPSTTPTLFGFGSNGVLFPHFYSNAVQTVRSQESALCGLPPSLSGTLATSYAPAVLERLPCLPRLLKRAGYRTVYFQNDTFSFSRQGEFLRAIGFEELHGRDILLAGDPVLRWGFREDVFFQRVAERLVQRTDEPLFAMVAVSGTNHFPWSAVTDVALQLKLPFPSAASFPEHLANTTFAQDAYLGEFLDRLGPQRADTMVFVYSDNGLQLDRPDSLASVEYDAREGSFLTFLLVLPPADGEGWFARGRQVAERYSQMDLLPTVAELLGFDHLPWLGRSFAAQLDSTAAPPRTARIPMVQPFTRPRLVVVDFPAKYLADFQAQRLYRFDLERDPAELTSQLVGGKSALQQLVEVVFTPYLTKPRP